MVPDIALSEAVDNELEEMQFTKTQIREPIRHWSFCAWTLTFIWSVGFGAWNFSTSAIEVPSGFLAETIVRDINAATAMTIAPDGRVFFAEQTGVLRVWKDDHVLPELALDLSERLDTYWERGLIGMTLHPDFPHTPYMYIVYVAKDPHTHHVVSRFIVIGDRVDLASEQILLEGDDQSKLGGFKPSGHQGGPIRIGPDGKLYIGLGEQTAGKPAQALDSLLGKILRINLDGSIPEDNPFYTQTTGKYRSIWAIGIRNPFGLVFESDTERLWETDVGQTAFEEVNIIVKGGNYGWPDAEGLSANTAFANPIHAYPPAIGRSIVGGMFYPYQEKHLVSVESSLYRFPGKWNSQFFFADWAAHWIKVINPKNPKQAVSFARNLNGPVALEPAPDGSLFVLNRGTIWRDPQKFVENSGSLVRIRFIGNDAFLVTDDSAKESVPNDLTSTDLFESLKPFKPKAELVEFEINATPWQPGVQSRRWISLPSESSITFRPDGEWEFPNGTTVIQHFTLDGGTLDGSSFETHVFWFNGPRRVRAGAYRWNGTDTEATLVADGEFIPLPGQEKRHWFTPGSEPNLNLDLVVTGFVLPLNTRQVNRDYQLEKWNRNGWFNPALTNITNLPQLANLDDTDASRELRVRSFLDANCAACHRPDGSSRGNFEATFNTPLNAQNLINGSLVAGDLGIMGAKVIVPGHPDKSILLQRVKRTDFFRMPPFVLSDDPSPLVPLLEEWIRSLPEAQSASAK